jgi:hypothetical protein
MMDYVADFFYGATKYPCALFRPKIFLGHFKQLAHAKVQKEFYTSLLARGFKRTVWQLVFPGQVAGLIKRIPPTATGVNEYHVRFYQDGTIECELEVDRWSTGHWSGPRHHKQEGESLLRKILREELPGVSTDLKKRIEVLIGSKDFTSGCIRRKGAL